MVLKRLTPSYRSRGTKQPYSDLNPMTEAKLKRASCAKYRRHATISHTNINTRRLAEGTHLNTSKHKVLSPIHRRTESPIHRRTESPIHRRTEEGTHLSTSKHKVLSPIHRRTDRQTSWTINPVDNIRNRTLHGSNPKPLPGISSRVRGHTIDRVGYTGVRSYLNPLTASKLERSRSMLRDKNEQFDQSYLTATKLERSRSMKRGTHAPVDQRRPSAPSNNKPLPQLNKSDNNNKLRSFKMSSDQVDTKRDSADSKVSGILTIPGASECSQSQQSDDARLRKPSSVFSSKVNNFTYLKSNTADDFRGYNGCPPPSVNSTKICEGDDSFERQAKLREKSKPLDCKSKPLGKWYPLPEIGKQKKQGPGQRVVYNLNQDNQESDDKQSHISHSLGKEERKKIDEIPIPQPTTARETTYNYRYSSAGPSWSGKTHKEAAVSQCRREVMAQIGLGSDPYKDNLNLSKCYQDPRYETTSLTEGMRPFRVRQAYHRNYLLPMKRLYAPWKVNTEFGRYVTDTLHPRWPDNPRYKRKVKFHQEAKFGSQ